MKVIGFDIIKYKLILLIIMFMFVLKIYYYYWINNENRYMNYKYEGMVFKIRNRKDVKVMRDVAGMLKVMNDKKDILINYLITSNEEEYDRLITYGRDVKLEEILYKYDNEVAYSVNKGERIGLCVMKGNKMQDENTMMFVLLHELAHVMSPNYDHDDIFWENFKLLIEKAIECGVYKYVNYYENSKMFCGRKISDTPYVIR